MFQITIYKKLRTIWLYAQWPINLNVSIYELAHMTSPQFFWYTLNVKGTHHELHASRRDVSQIRYPLSFLILNFPLWAFCFPSFFSGNIPLFLFYYFYLHCHIFYKYFMALFFRFLRFILFDKNLLAAYSPNEWNMLMSFCWRSRSSNFNIFFCMIFILWI